MFDPILPKLQRIRSSSFSYPCEKTKNCSLYECRHTHRNPPWDSTRVVCSRGCRMDLPVVTTTTTTATATAAAETAAAAAAAVAKRNGVAWTTRLTQQFPWVRLPVIGAPMAGAAGGKLAAAVARAGGLGFIAAGHWLSSSSNSNDDHGMRALQYQVDMFRRELQPHSETADVSDLPLCLGFIGHSTFRDRAGWERFESVLQTYRPAVVQFFAPAVCWRDPNHGTDPVTTTTTTNVALAQQYHAKVLVQVGTVREALEALDAGVDGLMVQGSEAGGHGVRRERGSGTLSLVATVAARVRSTGSQIPVVAAGGIVDGRTMAAALALGCDGVVLGTRLWATHESLGWPQFKDRLVATESCDDVVRTATFDWIQNTYTDTPWPEPYDSSGALRNDTSDQWEGRLIELAAELLQQTHHSTSSLVADYRRACVEGNADMALVHAGEGVGLITAIEPADEIVKRISDDAANVIRSLPKQLLS